MRRTLLAIHQSSFPTRAAEIPKNIMGMIMPAAMICNTCLCEIEGAGEAYCRAFLSEAHPGRGHKHICGHKHQNDHDWDALLQLSLPLRLRLASSWHASGLDLAVSPSGSHMATVATCPLHTTGRCPDNRSQYWNVHQRAAMYN